MASREFEVLDIKGTERTAMGRYEVIKACLDGDNKRYEYVASIEDNCGYLSVYRDSETSSAISLEVDANQENVSLKFVGERIQFAETLEGIVSMTPRVFNFI